MPAIAHEFEDGNTDVVTASTTFVDAGCTSNVLTAADWFVVGLANYRQEAAAAVGFAPEVEARLGTTRIALGGWRVLFGELNPGDPNGAYMGTIAIVTADGSSTLNYRVRADNGDGAIQEVRFGGASWMAWSLAELTLNTDYWVAQATNSDSAEVTAVGNSWVEGSASGQLTFTPAETGDYLICASAEGFVETDTPAGQETARFRLRMTTDVGGTPTTATIGNEQESQQDTSGGNATQYQVPMAQWDVRTLTAGITYEIFWEFSNDAGGAEMGYRRSRVVAFRLAAFANYAFQTYYDGFQASSGTTEATTVLTYDFGAVDVAHFGSCSYQNAGSFGQGLFRHDGTPDVDYPSMGRMYVPNNIGTGATNDIPILAFDALVSVSGSQTWLLAGTSDSAPILTFGRNQGDSADTRSVLVAVQMNTSGVTGTFDSNLPLPTLAATGDVAHSGTFAGTLPVPTMTTSGNVAHSGSFTGTLPVPTLAATGDVAHSGSFAGALPIPVLASTGDVAHTGTFAATLLIPTMSVSGQVAHAGVFAGTLPLIGLAATGVVLPGPPPPPPTPPTPSTPSTQGGGPGFFPPWFFAQPSIEMQVELNDAMIDKLAFEVASELAAILSPDPLAKLPARLAPVTRPRRRR